MKGICEESVLVCREVRRARLKEDGVLGKGSMYGGIEKYMRSSPLKERVICEVNC